MRLLSIAQARHAAATSKLPVPMLPAPASSEASAPPATISAMPNAMRRSKFSRNTNQAISAVNTPSRLSSRDAVEAGVAARPSINRTGPATPPESTAPASQGRSAAASRAEPAAGRNAIHAAKPRPLPAYNSPASRNAGISPARSLAAGVLAPNSRAAASALAMARFGGMPRTAAPPKTAACAARPGGNACPRHPRRARPAAARCRSR